MAGPIGGDRGKAVIPIEPPQRFEILAWRMFAGQHREAAGYVVEAIPMLGPGDAEFSVFEQTPAVAQSAEVGKHVRGCRLRGTHAATLAFTKVWARACYRRATATIANNAITATVLDHDLDTDAVFATYDLDTGSVGTAGNTGFAAAPADDQELVDLLQHAATYFTP